MHKTLDYGDFVPAKKKPSQKIDETQGSFVRVNPNVTKLSIDGDKITIISKLSPKKPVVQEQSEEKEAELDALAAESVVAEPEPAEPDTDISVLDEIDSLDEKMASGSDDFVLQEPGGLILHRTDEIKRFLADDRRSLKLEKRAVHLLRKYEDKDRLEAERLAAEEEERRRERERNRRGYHWKDVIFEGGVGITKLLYDKEFKNFYDEKLALALNARAMFLPVKTRHNKFGLEACYLGQNLAKSNEYFDAKLTANVATAKSVWHHELFRNFYLSVKGGGGACLFQKSIEYASDYSSRQASSGKTYFYPAACGNLSIFCNALKFIVFEVGAEYTHVLVNSSSFGIVTPYACAGLRF